MCFHFGRIIFQVGSLTNLNESYSELIETLHALQQVPNLKLCLSSRPWNEFSDTFRASRSIMLQDYTEDNIRIYVLDCLKDDHRFAKDNPRHEALLEDIVNKAQGVFLWVALVVKSCIRGLTNADDILELEMRIRDLPSDLESFFSHMFESIEGSYREQTAQIFRVVIDAVRPLSVVALANIEKERIDPQYWLNTDIRPFSYCELTQVRETVTKRLNARCKGMLEITEVHKVFNSDWYTEYQVEFLHRTVRDFLRAPHMRTFLSRWTARDFNPHEALCKALLVQIKIWPVQDCPPSVWNNDTAWAKTLYSFMYYSGRIEDDFGLANVALLDHLDFVLQAHSETMKAPMAIPCNSDIRPRPRHEPVFSLLTLASRTFTDIVCDGEAEPISSSTTQDRPFFTRLRFASELHHERHSCTQ